MFAVGITAAVDENEIRILASEPKLLNENYWMIEDYSSLNENARDLVEGLCSFSPTPAPAITTAAPVEGISFIFF